MLSGKTVLITGWGRRFEDWHRARGPTGARIIALDMDFESCEGASEALEALEAQGLGIVSASGSMFRLQNPLPVSRGGPFD